MVSCRASAAVAVAITALAGCGDNVTILNPPRDEYGVWKKIEPEGALCGNGSPYKFFVNFSDTTDDVVIVFEPGGACWDYPSCTGAEGIRGAANIAGIPDDHYQLAPLISPFLQADDPVSPTADWNMVYVPYCTGDVHTGNNVMTYTDPTGIGPDVTFYHRGHQNVDRVVKWMDEQFTHVPRLLVTGCSAGGAGAITNYWFLRRGIAAVQKGYLLDDSGPIFPSSGFSRPLHDKIRDSWDVDSILDVLPMSFDPEDFGTLNVALADAFPNDRLATTYFRRDMNFSLYSYERFYDWPPKDEIMRMWDADTQLLVAQYDTRDNLDYYLPWWRELNDSHCSTLITFAGSEIQDHGLDLAMWVDDLIHDRPIQSAMEAPVPGEDD